MTKEDEEDMKNSKEILAKMDSSAHVAPGTAVQPDMAESLGKLGDGIANLHKAVSSEKKFVR